MDLRNQHITIYGAGGFGQKVHKFLFSKGIKVDGFIDANKKAPIDGLKVQKLNNVKVNEFDKSLILLCIWSPGINVATILYDLESKGFKNILHAGILSDIFPEDFNHYLFTSKNFLDLNKNKINSVFEILDDEVSKEVYYELLDLRYNLNFKNLRQPDLNNQYFPIDIPVFYNINWNEEIFCDIGAFTGDTFSTIASLSDGSLKHYIGFEPDDFNFKMLDKQLNDSKISFQLFKKGTWEFDTTLRFNNSGNSSSAISTDGVVEIDCIKLDTFSSNFKLKPTYFKMDVEGAEMPTLKGMKDIIINDKPKLAISLYHLQNDLWEIPIYIKSLNTNYKMNIRSHEYNGLETVLYCY